MNTRYELTVTENDLTTSINVVAGRTLKQFTTADKGNHWMVYTWGNNLETPESFDRAVDRAAASAKAWELALAWGRQYGEQR